MTEIRVYEVEMFYDPRKVGALNVRDLYQRYDLESPSVVDLERPFFKDNSKGQQVAATKFAPLSKKCALELIADIMDFPNARAEVNPVI